MVTVVISGFVTEGANNSIHSSMTTDIDWLDPIGIGYGGWIKDKTRDLWDTFVGDLTLGELINSTFDIIKSAIQSAILWTLDKIVGLFEKALTFHQNIVCLLTGTEVDENGEYHATDETGIAQNIGSNVGIGLGLSFAPAVSTILIFLYVMMFWITVRLYALVLDYAPMI